MRASGIDRRLRRWCFKYRKPHFIFKTRDYAENALFTWTMRRQMAGSRTAHFLEVFACGDHFHIGRNWGAQ